MAAPRKLTREEMQEIEKKRQSEFYEMVDASIHDILEARRLRCTYKPTKESRVFFNIYEAHCNDPKLPFKLAELLARFFEFNLIAVEQPIERNASARLGSDEEYKGDLYPEYSDALEKLRTTVGGMKIAVECMDMPLSEFEKIQKKYSDYLRTLSMKSWDPVDTDKSIDSIRNAFMACYLYHFTSAKHIITMNGAFHSKDLSQQLMQLDPKVSLLPIFLNVIEKGKDASVTIEMLKLNQAVPCLHINVSDIKDLENSDFIGLILQAIQKIQFESKSAMKAFPPVRHLPHIILPSEPSDKDPVYKSDESKDAVLGMDLSDDEATPTKRPGF